MYLLYIKILLKKHKKSFNRRITDIDKQISKLIDLYQVEGISIDVIKSRVDLLQKEKDTLNDKISVPVPNIKETKNKFISMMGDFDNVWSGNSLEEKRLFVSSVIKSIVINDENITINWRI